MHPGAATDRRRFLIGAGCVAVLALPARASSVPVVRFRELYAQGTEFSDFALAHADRVVAVQGYMAPPLKAMSRFFVLTRLPMSYCPFCESEAEWPETILVVYTREVIEPVPYNLPIVAEGRLELGGWLDPELGFWSKMRLMDADFRPA
jgi:hypothetical protein